MKRYSLRHPDRALLRRGDFQKMVSRREAHVAEMAEVVRAAKDQPCLDCGERYPPYVMDLDHRGDKKFNVSQGLRRPLEEILAEIAKCDPVCANCHRERTWRRLQSTSPAL